MRDTGKDSPRGRVIVFTGEGKGKTTAALGCALRASGQGLRTAIVQFLKSGTTGERHTETPALSFFCCERFDFVFGEPTQRQRDEIARLWRLSRSLLRRSDYSLIVLDEILLLPELSFCSKEDILDLLKSRDPAKHVILTGRGRFDYLFSEVDTITEMKKTKHAYDNGIGPTRGIEY